MIKEVLTTAIAVAIGVVLAAFISKKVLKTGDWEEWEDSDGEDIWEYIDRGECSQKG